jgi:hypothetical protein
MMTGTGQRHKTLVAIEYDMAIAESHELHKGTRNESEVISFVHYDPIRAIVMEIGRIHYWSISKGPTRLWKRSKIL